MFRTVIIHTGERIDKKDNWLVLHRNEEEYRVPLEDVYCVVIDSQQMLLSTAILTALTRQGAHILLCDASHFPVTAIYSQNGYYHPLTILRRQLFMDEDLKDVFWRDIVRAKLINQARVLELAGVNSERIRRLRDLAEEVEPGDGGNREGIGAKWFFRSLYGANFIRMADDGINAALNYGYTIIRSAMVKTLCAYGYNTVCGLHHISESNPFNLADDMMEPWRPIVDFWVDKHHEELVETLSKEQRTELIGLVNKVVLFQDKKMRLRNAMDRYISSFTAAVEKGKPSLLCFPTILPFSAVGSDE